MNEEIRVRVSADIATFQRNMRQVSSDISGVGTRIGGIMKQIAAVTAAGTAVAGAALLKFGKEAVTSAADMQAVNAQFDQVFGSLGAEATTTLQNLGKEFGMMPERLKAPLSMTTSMFKGLGLSTEEALAKATTATTLAADAAAFYDKSYEDANAALNSFIKGNYEGGEAIGLFANETQLANWASKELGLSWKTLDEAGKQVARLEYATAMQEMAGATGQAARESDSLVNQQANLKAEWTQVLAKLGEPVLPIVIDWIKQLSSKISEVNTDKLIQGFKDFYERGKEVVSTIVEFVNKWSPLLAGILAGVVAFKAITAGIVAYNAILRAYQTIALIVTTAQLGLNAAMRANPIGFVVTAIGILVAAGVLLYKNWDVIKAKAIELWSIIKTKFNDIKNAVTTKMNEVKTTISNIWTGVVAFFKAIDLKQIGMDIISGLIKGIGSMAKKVKDKVAEIANLIPKWAKDILGIHSPIEKSSKATKKRALSLAKRLAKTLSEPSPKFILQEVNID